VTATGSTLRSLECRACCTEVDPDTLHGTCPTCGHTLLARYALDRVDGPGWWRTVRSREPTLWKYRELLPVRDVGSVVTLGEHEGPVLRLFSGPGDRGAEVWAKDDGGLPTGSFKARGMSVAVSRARELGVRRAFAPSAGNAGLALAAYGARARLPVAVYLPERADPRSVEGVRRYGAEVVSVGATIREAGEEARRREAGRAFDLSTLREPYRVEGKKTMAFEIFERFGPEGMPAAVVYPTGGGTGLVGMHKGFEELRTLGLLAQSPRLIAVQAEGCAPVVQALRDGSPKVTPCPAPATIAPGLAVPAPFASERVLEAVRATGGTGVAVPDQEIVSAQATLARDHGLAVSLEAAAPWAAMARLVDSGAVRPQERVLLYLTGRASA
jgi:threonine synthase